MAVIETAQKSGAPTGRQPANNNTEIARMQARGFLASTADRELFRE